MVIASILIGLRCERFVLFSLHLPSRDAASDEEFPIPSLSTLGLPGQMLEGNVQNRILPPIFVVKVPPFVEINVEALLLECITEQSAVPPLQRSPTGIECVRSF